MWSVTYDVDIDFKNVDDREKIDDILESSWLPFTCVEHDGNGETSLHCYERDYMSHFPTEYEEPLKLIEKYVENGSIYFSDDENSFWKIELNKDTDYKWVERTGYIQYEPVSKGRTLNTKGE